MQRVPNVKTVRGVVAITMEDKTWTHEWTVTTINRWVKTPFGKVNFGSVHWSQMKLVEVKR